MPKKAPRYEYLKPSGKLLCRKILDEVVCAITGTYATGQVFRTWVRELGEPGL
jgi:hypothetical protein